MTAIISNKVLAEQFAEMSLSEKQALLPHERMKFILAKEAFEKETEFNSDPFGVFKASKKEIANGIARDEDSRF